MQTPRVAFFTDSFHEVNGVALTSREFDAFARRRELPLLSVHTGPETRCWTEGQHQTFELAPGSLRVCLEKDLFLDLLFLRHHRSVAEAVLRFRPDLVHIPVPGTWASWGSS